MPTTGQDRPSTASKTSHNMQFASILAVASDGEHLVARCCVMVGLAAASEASKALPHHGSRSASSPTRHFHTIYNQEHNQYDGVTINIQSFDSVREHDYLEEVAFTSQTCTYLPTFKGDNQASHSIPLHRNWLHRQLATSLSVFFAVPKLKAGIYLCFPSDAHQHLVVILVAIMDVFLSNLPPDISDKALKTQLTAKLSAIGIYQDWACTKHRKTKNGILTFLHAQDGETFLREHGAHDIPGQIGRNGRPKQKARLYMFDRRIFCHRGRQEPDQFHLKALRKAANDRQKKAEDDRRKRPDQ